MGGKRHFVLCLPFTFSNFDADMAKVRICLLMPSVLTWCEVRWLHSVSRREGLPLYSSFTFLIISSPAHCELSLKGAALIPHSLSPCTWLPITSPTVQATGAIIQIQKHNPLPHHHSPPFTPSPGIFFSLKSSCHLTLTALLLRCASALSLSWFNLLINYTAKERHIFNFP